MESTRTLLHDPDLLEVLETISAIRNTTLELLAQRDALNTEAVDHQAPTTDNDIASRSISTELENTRLYERSKVIAHITHLRGQHRRTVLSVRNTRQGVADARGEVDRLNLQLQNLVYEQKHLRGEIAACENYDHKYRNLLLISEEDFLDLFSDKRGLSDHQLMIARIEHEHAERLALEERRQGLLKRKQGLIAENKRRKDDLANLDKDLEKFIEAADPIIKTFEKEY